MAPSWAIPVATLSAICGVAFIFIWWWFPRMWKKGTQQEMELAARERAERERYMQQRNLEAGVTPEVKQAAVSTEEKDAPPASAQEKQSSAVPTPE